MTVNMNQIRIEDGCHDEEHDMATLALMMRQNVHKSADGSVRAYFDGLESQLIKHISDAEVVVGCVAWLTNERILDALAGRHAVSIVVQKEDFLRPDLQARPGWALKLRAQYDSLPAFIHRDGMGTLIKQLNYGTSGCEPEKPVRCVGNLNSAKSSAFPRAHHKFVLFGKYSPPGNTSFDWADGISHLYGVWTGSFNFTANATNSLENALYITDPEIVTAYNREYQYVYALSEPLDWETEWVAPEFRIGT